MRHRHLFWVRAVGVPTLLVLFAYLVFISRFAPHTIVFYLIFLFFLLVDLTSLVPQRARDILVVLTATVLGLCIAEGAASAFEHKPTVSFKTKGLYVRNAVFGWGPGGPGVYHERVIDPNTGKTWS
jgi:hypothetical protein